MSAREPFQSLLNDIREATQTLANCAAKGALQKDGTRMSKPKGPTATHWILNPHTGEIRGVPIEPTTSEEERDAELAAREKTISDLEWALEKIAAIAGDYGDGAPDDHYLAHVMLQLEAIAKDALDEARGTHRKALETMQKRQQP